MDTITSLPKLPDAVAINKLLLEYATQRTHERNMEIDSFVNSSNKTSILIMEVFKGLIANNRA